MIVFRKARSARQTRNDLDAYLTLTGDELSRWLAREVQSWGEFSYSELENLIELGGLNDLIDWQARYAEVVNGVMAPAWLAAMAAAAKKATKGKIVLDDSDVDVKNWLKTRGGELITVLSEESKKAVAMVILRGQAEKVLPVKIAHQIRPLIGLNQRQAQANLNYRERVYQNLLSSGLPPVTAAARADKAALRYAGKQHRERADMIVNTELAFAYNRGADIGIKRAIKENLMGRCEMVWTTAGTNRVCPRCLALKDKVVGHTDEDGVTLPPLHPRCRCAIMYREIAEIKPRSNEPDKPQGTPKPSKQDGFVFDLQRFNAQPLPEGNYNLIIRTNKQARHLEGTKEYTDYVKAAEGTGFQPSKMPQGTDCQALVNEFHGKGTYDPNPKDNSPRERVNTGRIIGQYWDRTAANFVDTTWIEIVYSKKGTHIYPNHPPKED